MLIRNSIVSSDYSELNMFVFFLGVLGLFVGFVGGMEVFTGKGEMR
jgi:hypothetical protein